MWLLVLRQGVLSKTLSHMWGKLNLPVFLFNVGLLSLINRHSDRQGGMQAVQALNPRQVVLFPRWVALFLRQIGSVLPSQGVVQAVQALFPRQAALVPSQEGMQVVWVLNPRQVAFFARQVVLVLPSQGVVQALFPRQAVVQATQVPPMSSRDSPPKSREYTGRP